MKLHVCHRQDFLLPLEMPYFIKYARCLDEYEICTYMKRLTLQSEAYVLVLQTEAIERLMLKIHQNDISIN